MPEGPDPAEARRLGEARELVESEPERLVRAAEDFQDPSQEWRRLFANPAVSIAFSLRGDFPWPRVPGYVAVQLVGAVLAAWFLQAVVHVSASVGGNYPAAGASAGDAFLMEAVLTLGLVSVVLGTASGAQNLGAIAAIGVGSYIALAGLWGSPISGASMNPARSFGPGAVGADLSSYWVYVAGPLAGAALAVAVAFVLRAEAAGGPARPPPRATCSPTPGDQTSAETGWA